MVKAEDLQKMRESTAVGKGGLGAGVGLVPLGSILITEALNRRPARPPDHRSESRMLVALAHALAESPRTILQTMADLVVENFSCESAGFSLLAEDEKSFFWPAISGVWKGHIGGGTPRDFGPCADVLDCNAPLLFSHFERRYPYLIAAEPTVEECLLVPFHVEGRAVGTIWAINHSPDRRLFDAEDLRQLVSLGQFASAAYQTFQAVQRQEAQSLRVKELNLSTDDAIQAHRRVESLLEELKVENRRKDEFLAMLAHELRNPIAAIGMALSMLERVQGDAVKSAAHHRIAKRQMGNLVRLVDDLLDVSRITRGEVDLRMEEVDLTAIVRNALIAIQPAIEARGHGVSVTVEPGSFRMTGDATRLEQILVNLLTNAVKYTDPGGAISVRLAREVSSGETQAVLRLRDTGRGIPEEMLSRVFDLFVQVSPTIDRSTGGLGLGLTLVKGLVEKHGGSVSAHSEGPGQGSEFVVRLPLAQQEIRPRTALGLEKRAPGPPVAFKRQHVLIVEDSEDLRENLKEFLDDLGHVVMAAKDGLEGLARLLEFRPDVALVDVGLPGIDGYELARRARAAPGGDNLYLVALTGYGGPETKSRALDAGFDVHITKPIDIDQLPMILNGSKART